MHLITQLAVAVLCASLGGGRSEAKSPTPHVHIGMCDASGGVAIDNEHFLAASDEDSLLRLYRRDFDGPPIRTFDLTRFLEVNPKKPEVDLEAGARIGNTVYWISSHSRSKSDKERPARDRFFAISLNTNSTKHLVAPCGLPYKDLLSDLIHDAKLRRFNFAEASTLPPKAPGALNIEGLSATPEGGLLIGFRNPVPHNHALLIPMLNPAEVVQGKHAVFGDPIELDLGGLGIRDVQCRNGKYYIIAGSSDGLKNPHFFLWNGGTNPPVLISDRIKHFNPEALIMYPDKEDFQILSDDGSRKMDGFTCKQLSPSQRSFRSLWISPP